MRYEVVCLRRPCGFTRMSEVVAATDEPGVRRPCVVRGEGGVNIGCALGCLWSMSVLLAAYLMAGLGAAYLNDDEACPGAVSGPEVNAGLVV